MGIVVDIIIIAIIALSIFLGYRKGLVSLAIKLCAFVIAILVTLVLYKPVANFVVNTTNIDETIENAILEKANDVMEDNNPQEIVQIIEQGAKEGILPGAARQLAINIVTGGVIIILFILVKIALRFITALANVVTNLPIIKQFNKGGGAIYGALRGIILIYVCLIIVSVFGQINPSNSIHENIEKSYIGKIMYQNNILNVFFK